MADVLAQLRPRAWLTPLRLGAARREGGAVAAAVHVRYGDGVCHSRPGRQQVRRGCRVAGNGSRSIRELVEPTTAQDQWHTLFCPRCSRLRLLCPRDMKDV